MKQSKKLTRIQKQIVGKAGLDPSEWRMHYENDYHLHIVSSGDPAELKIIDKKRKVVI